jgi:cytochrome c
VRSVVLPIALVATALVAEAQGGPPSAGPPGDAVHGKVLWQACASCHSIDENDVGPKHRGVFGRRAGTVPDYLYSAALKASGITWDDAALQRWLVNPSAMVPGTKMFYKVSDPQAIADLVAYLKELK